MNGRKENKESSEMGKEKQMEAEKLSQWAIKWVQCHGKWGNIRFKRKSNWRINEDHEEVGEN